jgi:DNA repair photolyase
MRISPHAKDDFEKRLLRDIRELKSLGVPAVSLHISNSTDALQKDLEDKYHHTLYALQNILKDRRQLTSVVILTKNPEVLCSEPYFSIITKPEMKPFTVQITCEFWNDEYRRFFAPNAPNIESHLSALAYLSKRGIEIDLRIDPLFPSARISFLEQSMVHQNRKHCH